MMARLGGVLCATIGLGLLYWFAVQPLPAARAGEQALSLSITGVVMSPVLLLSGLAIVVGGAPVADQFVHGSRASSGAPRLRAVIVVVGLVIGLALYFGLRTALEHTGYAVGGLDI